MLRTASALQAARIPTRAINRALTKIRSLPDGQATIKQFCEALCIDPEESTAYQSARRRLDKLADAGLADKDKDGRGRVYVAKVASE